MVDFPSVTWGICERCGERTADAPASELSSADSTTDLDTTGNGTELILFRGDYMCRLCRQWILDREASLRAAERRKEEDSFRARAGFQKTIS